MLKFFMKCKCSSLLFQSTLFATLFAASNALATPIDVVAAFGITPHTPSPYRSATKQLGYDTTRGIPLAFESELGVLFEIWRDWLAIGPVLRGYFAELTPAYTGMPSIGINGSFLSVREEFIFLNWPRLFIWSDQGFGLTWFGANGDRAKMIGGFAFRMGIGLRIGTEKGGAQIRFGYSYSPSLSAITAPAGGFDFGGLVLALEGAFRVKY